MKRSSPEIAPIPAPVTELTIFSKTRSFGARAFCAVTDALALSGVFAETIRDQYHTPQISPEALVEYVPEYRALLEK